MLKGTLNKFNIKEGRVAFEIKKDKVNLRDNQPSILVKLIQNGNFILLEKTVNDTLKFSYLDIETGKATLEEKIVDLSSKQDYTFILSWSAQNKIIKMYINGNLRGTAEIVPLG